MVLEKVLTNQIFFLSWSLNVSHYIIKSAQDEKLLLVTRVKRVTMSLVFVCKLLKLSIKNDFFSLRNGDAYNQ